MNIHDEIVEFLLQAEEAIATISEKRFVGSHTQQDFLESEDILDVIAFMQSLYVTYIPLKDAYNLLDWDEAFIRKVIARFKYKLNIRTAPTHVFALFNTAFVAQYSIYQAGTGENSNGNGGQSIGNISGISGQMLIYNSSGLLEAFTPPTLFGVTFDDL